MDWYIWIIVGIGLISLEMLTPGFYSLWIGIAAFITGILQLVFSGIPFFGLAIIFAILAVAISILGKIFVYKKEKVSTTTINQRTSEFVGKKYLVIERIANGRGKVKIGDSIWTVKSDKEVDVGEYVTITGTDGVYLSA